MTAEPLPTEAAPRRRGRPRGRNEIVRNGTVAGLDPETLAARFGTPLYDYDLDVLERQVRSLAGVLPPSVDLAYAVKANPALGVVAHIGSLGLGADVASGGELETALAAGIPPDRIVFTGPGKLDDELRLAVRRGIRAITVESLRELERLATIAETEGRQAPVLLRDAVSRAARLERVRLVGDDGAGKFGLGPDELLRAAAVAVRSPHHEPLGLHAVGASNVLDAAALADHVATTVAAAVTLAGEAGFPLRIVDVGGGIGIPYESHEESFDLAGFGRRMAELAAAWACDPVLRETRLLVEPGRFLVGQAGAYLARVVDRKALDGRDVVIVDGGIHHLVRPALVGQEHRVRRFGRPSAGPARFAPVTIAGPLCSGLDVLATEAMVRTPDVGDLVAVLDVGAYGFTESMPFFLSHPLPAEVAVRDGRPALLRPRLEPSTVLGWQRLPTWREEDGETG
jgi:diaminopimelate decarboxylase